MYGLLLGKLVSVTFVAPSRSLDEDRAAECPHGPANGRQGGNRARPDLGFLGCHATGPSLLCTCESTRPGRRLIPRSSARPGPRGPLPGRLPEPFPRALRARGQPPVRSTDQRRRTTRAGCRATPADVLVLCFPKLLARVNYADVVEALEELQRERMVQLYEVDDRPFVQIVKWWSWQTRSGVRTPRGIPHPRAGPTTCTASRRIRRPFERPWA